MNYFLSGYSPIQKIQFTHYTENSIRNSSISMMKQFNNSVFENFVSCFRQAIFQIQTKHTFEKLALDLFRFQANYNPVYKRFIEHLKINVPSVGKLNEIPFLPVDFFKTYIVSVHHLSEPGNLSSFTSSSPLPYFQSSGTTGTNSRHYVQDISLYEESFRRGFEYFYGDVRQYCIFALLPSYMEQENSSLVYMVRDLITRSGHKESGFYLNDTDELYALITDTKIKCKKLLLGVSFALWDIAEKYMFQTDNLLVMETGGMKGRKKEMPRKELHDFLCRKSGVKNIHSEYGMTELFSQAYSKEKGIFKCPPWMTVLIRDIHDPLSIIHEKQTGGINIIDLANLFSCAFIATQDLGRKKGNGTFEVLGRFDNSDLRGCNLMLNNPAFV